jgi:protein-S-isoprenylcysteine O-methyltransferase Ste14
MALLALHALVWAAFVVTRLAGRAPRRDGAASATSEHRAGSTVLIWHGLAFVPLYAGIWRAALSNREPALPFSGAVVILAGMGLMLWTLRSFHSWRLNPRIDHGHQLATEGPFRLMRHPIYCGLDLLALGSVLWQPTLLDWIGFVAVAVTGDLRARTEEKLLLRAFGDAYADYCRKTPRIIPGIY